VLDPLAAEVPAEGDAVAEVETVITEVEAAVAGVEAVEIVAVADGLALLKDCGIKFGSSGPVRTQYIVSSVARFGHLVSGFNSLSRSTVILHFFAKVSHVSSASGDVDNPGHSASRRSANDCVDAMTAPGMSPAARKYVNCIFGLGWNLRKDCRLKAQDKESGILETEGLCLKVDLRVNGTIRRIAKTARL
jgi:hypothetical protein